MTHLGTLLHVCPSQEPMRDSSDPNHKIGSLLSQTTLISTQDLEGQIKG